MFGISAITTGIAFSSKNDENIAECGFTDKNLDDILVKINNGLEDLY
jgi:hypothetical protein